jgi:ribosomal protein L7/L12
MISEYAVSILFSGDDMALEVVKAKCLAEAIGVALGRYKGTCIKNWASSWLRDCPEIDAASAAIPLLQVGRKIGAIKAVREVTGFGLKEAKALVDKLIEDNPELYQPNNF